MDPILDSAAGGRPNFLTTQWSLVVAASAQGDVASRDALEELYRLYCYPVYAFIRRRGHSRHDAQDLTQDFFVHLLEKGTLSRADPERGRFRSFLLELEGRGDLFQALKGFLLGTEDTSYQQIADGLSLSLGAVKTVIHRLRGRYRALLREEVARTVAAPAEVDEELRYLRTALRG